MATGTAYLEGGPCAGTKHKITPAESDTGEIVCKGALYKNPMKGQLRKGDIVFKYAGKAPPPGGTTPGILKSPHALGGWKAIRKSINRTMPKALATSRRNSRAALRSITRARKVHL